MNAFGWNLGGDNMGIATAGYNPAAPVYVPPPPPARLPPVNIGLTRSVPYQPSSAVAMTRYPSMAPPARYPGQRIPVPQTRRFHGFGLAPGAPYPTRATYEHIRPLRAFGMGFGATTSQQSATYVAAMTAARNKPVSGQQGTSVPANAAAAAKPASVAAVINQTASVTANPAVYYPAGATSAQIAAANARVSYNQATTPDQIRAAYAQANTTSAMAKAASAASVVSTPANGEAAAVQAGRVQDSPAALKVIQTYNQNVAPLGGQSVKVADVNAALQAQYKPVGLVGAAITAVQKTPTVASVINQTATQPAATSTTFNPSIYYPIGATPAQIAAANLRIASLLPAYGGSMSPDQIRAAYAQANTTPAMAAAASAASMASTPAHGEAAAVAAGRVQDSAAALKVVQDYNQSVYPTGGVQAKIADVNAALASGAAKTVTEAVLQSVPAAQAAQTVQFAQPQYQQPTASSLQPIYMGAPSVAPAGGVSVTVSPQAATDSAGNAVAPAGGNSVVIAAVIGALALWFTSK